MNSSYKITNKIEYAIIILFIERFDKYVVRMPFISDDEILNDMHNLGYVWDDDKQNWSKND